MANYFSRGKKLAEFIDEKAWNKAEFARRMSIHPQTVNKYLRGDLDPMNLADSLLREGCDLNWLCSDDAVPAVKEEAVQYSAEKEKEIEALAEKMYQSMRLWGPPKVDPGTKKELLKVIRKLAEETVAGIKKGS